MKLSEVKPEENLKILVYGNSGAGKTCFAAGFPYPMLYLDFDGKVDSAAAFYREDKERLDGIDVRDLSLRMSSDPIEEFSNIISELSKQEASNALAYKTIVLDSLTTFSSLCLKHIVKSNPGIKRTSSRQGVQPGLQDYGILRREFERLIPGLLGLKANIVMLGHIDTNKDELTGEIVRGPLLDGSFAKSLPIYFKEVYRAFVDKDEHLLQTKTDYKYSCRSQIPALPNPCSASYLELTKQRSN